MIDHDKLMELVGVDSLEQLRNSHNRWIEEILKRDALDRESVWTESIAVGSRHFAEVTMRGLGGLAKGRTLVGSDGVFQVRESQASYLGRFDPQNNDIDTQNTYSWNDNPGISEG